MPTEPIEIAQLDDKIMRRCVLIVCRAYETANHPDIKTHQRSLIMENAIHNVLIQYEGARKNAD